MIPYKDRKEGKKEQVQAMFNHIAHRYDFLNHFFSLGLDKYWRKKSIKILSQHTCAQPVVLDIATGTGDFVKALLKVNPKKITGVDIAEDMLTLARSKFSHHSKEEKIHFQEEDAENLSFSDNQFDLITIGFGVRNFENIPKGISEIYRVLKPNGIVGILELTTPSNFPMKQIYRFYSKTVIPSFGQLLSKDKSAYTYLPNSIQEFSKKINLTETMENIGFKNIHAKTMSFGVVTLFYGKKTN
ncbi:MAG TPA: bifunctional demethylmenaquinone methyltransferase/2-methoxy-6-polyprenyl-1,4-benzoquinol methylase UbiE [Bacteroidales bacterium]|nr:bifunctional demethylmenaquinone methyltransferase/2-methoxy-6-polyprenyl-1,4-benzoquinol methylase UbiE [Bacteroidales bacterium]